MHLNDQRLVPCTLCETGFALTEPFDEDNNVCNACKLHIAESKIEKLLAHCKEPECEECAKIICEYEDNMHYHHDGCPSCSAGEKVN